MGQVFSAFWAYWFAGKEYKIVMVGLDNAGKTTTLYRLHLGETVKTQPTIGSNVEVVRHDNLTFEVWDLGGQASLRPSWATYYKDTDAVVVVIDSTDRARVSIVRQELQALLGHTSLQASCILIFANKQDLKDAMTVTELSEALDMINARHSWHIQQSCALTGEGLLEGLQWVAQQVRNKSRQPAVG